MYLLAILAGLVAWGVVGAVTGQLVVHKNEAGMFPGLIAGIWAAWPLLHQGGVQRYNFLHPVPRRYKVPAKQAFKSIRTILAEKTYNMGDKWSVSTADTQTTRIHATLRFSDEKTEHSMDARGGVHSKTVHEKRHLEMDIQMKDEGNSTVIQFDFVPRIEGSSFFACDSIVEGLLRDTEAALGAGEQAGNPASTRVPAPPWWLLGLTAFGLFLLLGDVMQAVFHG